MEKLCYVKWCNRNKYEVTLIVIVKLVNYFRTLTIDLTFISIFVLHSHIKPTQLSTLSEMGNSTSQNAMKLCGWNVGRKAGVAH